MCDRGSRGSLSSMALTPQLQEIKDAVAEKYADEISSGDLKISGGVFNCRPMRPQPKTAKQIAYSEHSWSNAWDLYYGDRPRKYVDAVVRWLRLQRLLRRLPVGSIITYGPNGNHVHIEGKPKRNPKPWVNTPPLRRARVDRPNQTPRRMTCLRTLMTRHGRNGTPMATSRVTQR